MEAHEEELGPIDIVVIAYPADAPMTGEAVPLLLDLVERGIIRVLDVMFVMRTRTARSRASRPAISTRTASATSRSSRAPRSGLLGDDDVATAAEAIEPGTAAVLIVYENRWAAPFAAAVRRNGGVLIDNQRIPAQELMDALDAAEAAA